MVIRQLITSLYQALHEALLPLLRCCLGGCSFCYFLCGLLAVCALCWVTILLLRGIFICFFMEAIAVVVLVCLFCFIVAF